MTIESAKAQVDAIWAKLDPQTQEFADWLAESLDNPAPPMLMSSSTTLSRTGGSGASDATTDTTL